MPFATAAIAWLIARACPASALSVPPEVVPPAGAPAGAAALAVAMAAAEPGTGTSPG